MVVSKAVKSGRSVGRVAIITSAYSKNCGSEMLKNLRFSIVKKFYGGSHVKNRKSCYRHDGGALPRRAGKRVKVQAGKTGLLPRETRTVLSRTCCRSCGKIVKVKSRGFSGGRRLPALVNEFPSLVKA
jgi:hypothetical protein